MYFFGFIYDHQHETSWNSYEIYQKACMSFVPLPGQFEMDPLLGCWSRYLGTGAQDVAGRLGGATDQRQRRVFAVLSGVFHRSYDAFQQADPKTSGTWALNIKGGVCGDFAFVLGRGYHEPVFDGHLDLFRTSFAQSCCVKAFFLKASERFRRQKRLVLFTKPKETNTTTTDMTWQHKANRLGRTWDKFIMNELHGMTCGFIGALRQTWGWFLVLGGVSCCWCCRWYWILNDVVGSGEGLLLKSKFLMISIGKYSLKII